jgi:hypothetical protein
VRIALKRLERETPPRDDESELLVSLPDGNDSPELALLKQRCRDASTSSHGLLDGRCSSIW